MRARLTICTDGSCDNNGDRVGGWAFVATCAETGKQTKRHGFALDTTNNAMELEAIRRALIHAPIEGAYGAVPLLFVVDSQYCIFALTKWLHGWKRTGWKTSTGKPVANREQLEEMDALLRIHREFRQVSFVWQRGHVGHEGNEAADSLAGFARCGKLTNWKSTDERTTLNTHASTPHV